MTQRLSQLHDATFNATEVTNVPTLAASDVDASEIAPSEPTADATLAQALHFPCHWNLPLAGAYLKGLADVRMGDAPGLGIPRSDMTKVDMQFVRVAYNEGLRTFLDAGNGTLSFYQSTSNIKSGGVGAEVSPWVDAFAEIYAP